MNIILAMAALSAAASVPALLHPTAGERRALLAAGCELRAFPNPTGKIITPPPTVRCPAEVRAALDRVMRGPAETQVAGRE